MVNENKGKVYNPTPIYNRKMYRQLCKTAVIVNKGYHNVNRTAGMLFRQSMAIRKSAKKEFENIGVAVEE